MLEEVYSKLSLATRKSFDEQVSAYQIESKVHYVVTDNAKNMKAAFANSSFIWFGCSVHQIQLVLKHTMDNPNDNSDVKRQIQLVRELIGYVNHANKQHLFDIRLEREVATRFDSLYIMLNSLIKNKDILAAIDDEEVKKHLNKIDFDLINKIKTVLGENYLVHQHQH